VSALERPSEVLILAHFEAAGRAEAAARAFLPGGVNAAHLALLARDTWGTAFPAVPHSVAFERPGLGRLRAGGALAVELEAGLLDLAGHERLGVALRRVGLGFAEVPRLERALRANRILVLAVVPSREAFLWGRLLQSSGAVFLSARPRLRPWPPPLAGAVRRKREDDRTIAGGRRARAASAQGRPAGFGPGNA